MLVDAGVGADVAAQPLLIMLPLEESTLDPLDTPLPVDPPPSLRGTAEPPPPPSLRGTADPVVLPFDVRSCAASPATGKLATASVSATVNSFWRL